MSKDDLNHVKNCSLWIDANVLTYDPRDHFDFAYIDEGWQRVNERLETGDLSDLAYAAHTIADFYAHSMYGHFGPRRGTNGPLVLYNPD